MNTQKHIGINGLFLRNPGSGIGQVTKFFLAELTHLAVGGEKYTLYIDAPETSFAGNENIVVEYIKPWWQRDDRIRKLLWEHIQLPKRALADGVTHFLSLYQAPTEFPKAITHVMVAHDIIPELFPEYVSNSRSRLYWRLTKRAIQKATKIIAVSQSTKRDIIKHLKVSEEKIIVNYPSINPIFFDVSSQPEAPEVLRKYDLTPGYLYHGGGLEIRKNTESILTAYAAWRNGSGTPSQIPPLVISGTVHEASNPLATDVRGLIKKLQLEEVVYLLGFVPDEDLPALYREASLFLFPSKYEGFGMPMVEALSQGTAVLAERHSSLGEVGGECVFWTDTFNKSVLEMNYQKALVSAKNAEEKNIRVLQARGFSSWKNFTENILKILIH